MADFPKIIDMNSSIISNVSPETPSGYTTLLANRTYSSVTTAWPTSNLAFYIPFLISSPTTIVKVFWINGATVGTDHIDVGVYDSQGNRLVSTGSTLTSGANAVQIVDTTDTTINNGFYYMAMAMDGTTDRINCSTLPVPLGRALGIYEQTTAFALPATATFASNTRSFVPLINLTINTTI